jgi:hypothetical protein
MTAFDVGELPIAHVAKLMDVLWPAFFTYGGNIFLASEIGKERLAHVRNGGIGERLLPHLNDTAVESFHNHVHVLRLFQSDEEVWNEARSTYRRSHRDFKLAERVGASMAEMWFAKLRHDFPDDRFRVYYTRDDNPAVRFHRVYPDEAPWVQVSEDDDPKRRFVLDTAGRGRRVG